MEQVPKSPHQPLVAVMTDLQERSPQIRERSPKLPRIDIPELKGRSGNQEISTRHHRELIDDACDFFRWPRERRGDLIHQFRSSHEADRMSGQTRYVDRRDHDVEEFCERGAKLGRRRFGESFEHTRWTIASTPTPMTWELSQRSSRHI